MEYKNLTHSEGYEQIFIPVFNLTLFTNRKLRAINTTGASFIQAFNEAILAK